MYAASLPNGLMPFATAARQKIEKIRSRRALLSRV